jgi:hypothetical protein
MAGWLVVQHDPKRRSESTYTPLGHPAGTQQERPDDLADMRGPLGESAEHPYRETSSHVDGVEDSRRKRWFDQLVGEGKDPDLLRAVWEDLPRDYVLTDVIIKYRAAAGRNGERPIRNRHHDADSPAQRGYRAQVAAAWGEDVDRVTDAPSDNIPTGGSR